MADAPDVFEEVSRAQRAHFAGAALHAAATLGVIGALGALAPGPLGLDELAARLGLPRRRLRPLCDVLALDGVLARSGPHAAPQYALVAAQHGAEAPAAGGWGALVDVLRTDRPLDEDGVAGRAGEGLARFHAHLAEAGAGPARALAGRVLGGRLGDRAGPRVLDLGGGSGTYAAAILEDDAAARVVLVDRPAVLDLARARLGDRVTLVAGDLGDPPPAGPFDVVLLVNALHLLDEDEAAACVRRAASVLAPGGRVVIKDLAIAADRSGPEAAVRFALNLALYTPGGDVHDEAALRGMLEGAGLGAIETSARDGSVVLVGAAEQAG